MFTYISNTDLKHLCKRLFLFVGLLVFVQSLSAQNYVKTANAQQKEELAKAAKANRSKKLVYAVEKKSLLQRFREDSTAIINGFQVNVDVVGPFQSLIADNKYYEASAQVSIKDWVYPTFELGFGTTDYHEITSDTYYKCSAPYARLGFDVNLLRNRHDDYRLVLGARAAFTSFKYDISAPNAEDPVWGGNANYNITDAKCNFLWSELLAGVDARILGPLHLGWTMRYKFKLHSSYNGIDKAWYVPGFGKDDSSGFGATFNVGIDLWDFKKKRNEQ